MHATPEYQLTPKTDRDSVPDTMVRPSTINHIPVDTAMIVCMRGAELSHCRQFRKATSHQKIQANRRSHSRGAPERKDPGEGMGL